MSQVRAVRAPSAEHNNADLIVWACYVAGGYERWIDVEQLYLKAFELGPNRLGWRTQLDIPDYKKCAKALQEVEDPKRSDHLGLFLKLGRYTRKLSDEGLLWCESYRSLLEGLYGGGFVPSQSISEMARVLSAFDKSDAYRAYVKTKSIDVELWELSDALQCLPTSARDVWMARLDRLRLAADANGRHDVVEFIERARERVSVEVMELGKI
jgi:hypothetical protein